MQEQFVDGGDDFGGGEVASNESLAEISRLAAKQLEQEEKVANLKADLKQAEEALKYTSEVLLPNAMQEVGLSSFTMENGAAIEIKRDYSVGISAANWDAAEAWLRKTNNEGIIKHEVSLSFGKGDDDAARKALDLLVEQGFAPQDKKAIHFQTLKAFVKEQLSQGVDLPLQTFGAFEIVRTKITQPK